MEYDNFLIEMLLLSDIFVFPTLIESFGMVTLEAMCAGLAVATTDAPGSRDLVSHKKTGMISKVGDIKGMSRNIIRLIENDILRKNLSLSAKKYSETYDWEIVSDSYLDLY